jgi:hypothetical protein
MAEVIPGEETADDAARRFAQEVGRLRAELERLQAERDELASRIAAARAVLILSLDWSDINKALLKRHG